MNGKLEGKTCVVTGALGGIGRAAAERFAREGATVVLVGRGAERGATTLREISARVPGATLDFAECDLSSLASIRLAAQGIRARHPKLHVLLNQAGVYSYVRKTSADGFELMFAVNHLAYFLLTDLLLDGLKAGGQSRILNGTGAIERFGDVHFDDLQSEKKWKPFAALAQTKLCNVLHAAELARRLAGTGVTSCSFHPGSVKTTFGKEGGGFMGFVMAMTARFGTTPEAAAEVPLALATDPALFDSGAFFMLTKKTAPSKRAQDPALAARLWEVSARLVAG